MGQEVAIFWQTAANFRQRRYGGWKVQFCPIKLPANGESSASFFLHFWRKIFQQEENFPTA